MREAALRCVKNPESPVSIEGKEAFHFLKEIGFLDPDPSPPAPPERRYHPKTAVLLMTNRCNLRCTYCYAAAGEKRYEDMSFSLAKQAVDITAANAEKDGAKMFELVFHGGGEPTRNWDVLSQTIGYARRKSIKCNIAMSSNGVWSNREREYILDNFDGLSLSFDGTKEIQDAQRPTAGGGSSFSSAMKNISVLDRKNFPYNIRLTITSPWMKKLPESIRFICRETGCRHIQVEPSFNPDRGGWQNPSEEETNGFISAFIEALDVAQESGKELMYAGARPWLTICTFCSAADTALVVRPDGKLVACYEVTDSRHELADIFTIGSLTPAGPVIDENVRNKLSKMRGERLSLCEDCFCLWHCGGDCSSRCFSPEGTGHLKFKNRCRINREISKEILARYIADSQGVWRSRVRVLEEREMGGR